MQDYADYSEGFNAGWQTGYEDGYIDTSQQYEERISLLWVELQTLHARVDYLEKHTGLYRGEI